jgi:predicted helicase
VNDYLKHLIGFELQVGPFAVAQLRLLAELTAVRVDNVRPDALRLYLTNTLGNPYLEEESLGSWYEPISESRRQANTIKRDEPILVVMGNPPYKERSHGRGGWIESGSPGSDTDPPLKDFIPPRDWGVGAHVKHLYNPYVYFWRWATWKVFDHHPASDLGIVCFITVAGFLDGSGFEKMRDYLRRRADAIWVIDCSPEGHQPDVATRIFQAVQQPVCIMLALRDGSLDGDTPAPVYFWQLAPGPREAKFAELGDLTLADPAWLQCANDWRAPFLPAGAARWLNYPALDDLLRWSGSGTMPGRTWIVAPDKQTLQRRWDALVAAAPGDKPALMLEHPTDRRVDTLLGDALPGYEAPHNRMSEESGSCPDPVLIGYRSFDRQWIIPDKRLINRPNPTLWSVRSDRQVYLTAPQDTAPTSGPAATFTALVPDLHHFKGRGGRVYPLWLGPESESSNLAPGLVSYLGDIYGYRVEPDDIFAYLAAILAHPGFPAEFTAYLSTPGIRLPLTADPTLFMDAVRIGEQVLWLHTYGQRFYDEAAGRPRTAPRMPDARAPKLTKPISAAPDQMPDALSYDSSTEELRIGTGVITNITERMFSYDVSGMSVLAKWFGYRRKNRERPQMGNRRVSALQQIQPDHWLPEYTSDLINLLNVLGLLIDIEANQSDLLHAILNARRIGVDSLTAGGVLPIPPGAKKPVTWASPEDQGTLF